ncbi:hypothetical protein [Streptosporangium sp. NPDC087985]|uniref:hypothetical protein n=1 Tax=Streptosporangium sp. NPDC087985 TaxID=3366196 RepID=UPI00381113D9
MTVEEPATAVRVIDDPGVTVYPVGADHLERPDLARSPRPIVKPVTGSGPV